MSHITPEERLLELIKKAQGSLRMRKELKIFTKVNMILIGIIAIIITTFAIDVVKSRKNISSLESGFSELETMPLPEPADTKETAIEEKKEFPASKPDATAPAPEKKITVDLNLLGIITGDERQAIIEDREKGKTYFLYQGGSIEGFKVINISDTGVLLDCNGEKIELKI